ncbi:metallophosphoesterase [Cyanobium sp. NIES-981]|uniref:metallophosphoesterase n=1 Tax=Cyanobium sp. NIES-981 TaxID=1851505 RepID=UPI0007DE08EC|nr:metallophosphoesterase [Cyanobium sp. NIES-981]SBO42661.1 Metallophosphoesterase [Cyanobium sp. NIES-981]
MPAERVVAIGDVHGCATLLEQELQPHLHSGAELIILGDLFDRAPEPGGDLRVLERVRQLQQEPGRHGLAGVTVLRGNHEQMLLDLLEAERGGDRARAAAARGLWRSNGGDPGFLPAAREHRRWLEALPHTAIRGRHLFVHAGVRPWVRLERQNPDDLLWIRRPFLEAPEHGLPYTVVHGHTFRPDFRITRLPHRIGIDTGAYCSGRLTALPLTP